MNAPYAETVRKIDAADLPATTVKLAMRLLAAANPQIGMLRLTWDEFLDLAGCENRNAARRHLTRLVQAGAIHYETNERVRIDFLAWVDAPPAARPRAEMRASAPPTARADEVEGDETATESETDAPPAARPRAEMRAGAPPTARADPATYTHASAQGVELSWVGLSDPPDQNLGDQPNPTPLPPIGPDEKDWSVNLLTDPDVGLMKRNAQTISGKMPPNEIIRFVATWYTERVYAKPGEAGPGLLTWRLNNPHKHEPGPIPAQFLASDLYRRHYGRLSALDEPPEWFWSLSAPPQERMIELADGSWVRLEGGGR